MTESAATFNHQVTARHYIEIYEKLLQRPLIFRQDIDSPDIKRISNQKAFHKPKVEDSMTNSIPLERANEPNLIRFPKRKRDFEEQLPEINRVKK
jgi:hypothetical protein